MESEPIFSVVVSGFAGALDGAVGTVVPTVHCLAVLARGNTFILVRVAGSYSSMRISLGSAPSAGLIQVRASLRVRPWELRASRL
jgi:hypothetical protein